MCFSRPAIVARARRNVLELYLSPKNQFYKLDLPQNIINFLDVINEDYFVKFVMDFLIKLNKKSAKVDLVMDSEVVFEKTVPKTNDDADKISIEEFFSNIPIEPVDIARMTYISGNQHFLYAANRVYYSCLIRAFTKLGWRVNYVAPLNIFGFSAQSQVLDDKNLKIIRKGKKLAYKINFLEENKLKS